MYNRIGFKLADNLIIVRRRHFVEDVMPSAKQTHFQCDALVKLERGMCRITGFINKEGEKVFNRLAINNIENTEQKRITMNHRRSRECSVYT